MYQYIEYQYHTPINRGDTDTKIDTDTNLILKLILK